MAPVVVFAGLLARLFEQVTLLKNWVILAGVAVYLGTSWVLFWLAGEDHLVSSLVNFLYFAATTAATVGYGDFIPQSQAGRLVAAFFFFPGAVTIFTLVLAKLTGSVVEGVRKMADGKGSFSHKHGATVIIGYHIDRTARMIADLCAAEDEEQMIILITRIPEVTIPDGVLLVKAERLDAAETLRRGGVEHAAKVLIYANSDAESFNTCLAVRELNQSVHVAAYFSDRDTASRAERFAQVETVLSYSTEALVRAAQDPGASAVLQSLSSATTNSTVYSAEIKGGDRHTEKVRAALHAIGATLIAVLPQPGEKPVFSPYPETLPPGAIAYYIAEKRIPNTSWQSILSDAS